MTERAAAVPVLSFPVGSRQNRQAKAITLLLERRVTLRLVKKDRVHAEVRGTDEIHRTGFSRSHWYCDCEAKTLCSHIVAVQYVTLKPEGDAA